MAYSYDNKGTYSVNVSDTWIKISMWNSADQVELDSAISYTNLPTNMQSAASLAALLVQLDNYTGQIDGYATLDGTGKLNASQLPSSVAGGLGYSGTIDASSQTLDDLATALGGTTGDASKYVVITTAGTMSDAATTAKWELNTYDDGETINSATLEVGDKILCTAYDTDHHVFTLLNVTYGDASTSVKGIVTLSDVATRATLSGDHVITEGILATILNDDLLVDADFGTAGYMKTDGSGGYSIDNNTYMLASVATLVDGDFTSEGFMVRGASAGTYSIDSTTYQTQVTISADAASGGVDNDIWVQTS